MEMISAISSRLILLFSISVGILAVYVMQLQEANEYMGYMHFDIDLSYVSSATLALFLTGLLMPGGIKRPSDFLLFLHGIFVLLPFATLYPTRGVIVPSDFWLYFFTLVFPLVLIKSLSSIVKIRSFPSIIKIKYILFFLYFISAVGAGVALASPPASAGFNLLDIYVRRIEARDIFVMGTPQAYVNSIVVNGIAPFLSFYAGYQKRSKILIFSICIWLVYFYLLGVKAPILYILFGYFIGRLIRLEKIQDLPKRIYYFILLLLLIFFAEYCIFDYSFAAEYFIRRTFTIPPYLVSAYFDFMNSSPMNVWTLFDGAHSKDPIAFVVGEMFLGDRSVNANTNAFVYHLADNGIFMYLFVILIVASIFIVLDSAYLVKRQPVFLYLGFSYSILMAEQSATTALVSSGVGLLIALSVLARVSIR